MPGYQKKIFNKVSNHLNSSESHQLCLEHHGLFISVHLGIQIGSFKEKFSISFFNCHL